MSTVVSPGRLDEPEGRVALHLEKPIRTTQLRAVPYHAWANRDPGPMRVWIRSR